jgi:hypothetical protein
MIADDSQSVCRLGDAADGQLWLFTGPLNGAQHRVATAGSVGQSSRLDIAACSATSDRAVIAGNGRDGTTEIRVIALSTGRLLYQKSYAGATVNVTSSRDGRYVAEQISTLDARGQISTASTMIRRTLDGRIVARLDNRRVLRFSWDGMRVVTVAAYIGHDVTLLDWQTGKVLWGQAGDPGTDGRPAFAIAEPKGLAMAIALGSQPGRGEVDQLWIVSADGLATQVIGTTFYPMFSG